MKEILIYLRKINGYSQAETAEKTGVSRQSYSKYEKGTVIPSAGMIKKLASLYHVTEDFIISNELPPLPGKSASYNLDDESPALAVAEGASLSDDNYSSGKRHQPRTWNVYFDGNTLRLSDYGEADFSKGQRFKLVEVEENSQKKEGALKIINTILEEISLYNGEYDDDPFYKKAIHRRIEEKYGFIN